MQEYYLGLDGTGKHDSHYMIKKQNLIKEWHFSEKYVSLFLLPINVVFLVYIFTSLVLMLICKKWLKFKCKIWATKIKQQNVSGKILASKC